MTIRKIMVVDDSPTERAFMEGVLKKRGYEVLLVDSGEAAIERSKSEQPDLILDRKSTRLNSSHQIISYAVFCLKKKKKPPPPVRQTGGRGSPFQVWQTVWKTRRPA